MSPETLLALALVAVYVADSAHFLAIGEAPVPCYRPELRLSVDEPADLEVVRAVVVHFGARLDFTTAEVIAFLDAHPEIVALNRHVRQTTA